MLPAIPSWYSTLRNPIRGNFFRNEGLALHKAGHKVGMLVPPNKLHTWHGLQELAENGVNRTMISRSPMTKACSPIAFPGGAGCLPSHRRCVANSRFSAHFTDLSLLAVQIGGLMVKGTLTRSPSIEELARRAQSPHRLRDRLRDRQLPQ